MNKYRIIEVSAGRFLGQKFIICEYGGEIWSNITGYYNDAGYAEKATSRYIIDEKVKAKFAARHLAGYNIIKEWEE